MSFLEFSQIRENEKIIYETDTKKIYGNKIWIFFIGLWLILIILVIWGEDSIMDFLKSEYLQILLLTFFYYFIALYIYSKTFIITHKRIYILNIIKDRILFKRSYPLEIVFAVKIKTFKKIGKSRHNGEIDFHFKTFFRKEFVIPIYDYDPRKIFEDLLKSIPPSDQFFLYHKTTGKHLPIKFGLLLGREGRIKVLLKDPKIGRRHAQLSMEKGKLFITDLESRNLTFVNNVSLSANVKTPLTEGDTIKIGSQEFVVAPYSFQNNVKINFSTIFPLYALKLLIKHSVFFFMFIIFFFPIYIFFKIYTQEKAAKSCEQENLSHCVQIGHGIYQNGHWKEALAQLTPLCQLNIPEGKNQRFQGLSCFLVALANKNLGKNEKEKTYLQKACDLKIPPACARLSLHNGNSKLMEHSIDDLLELCQDKQQGSACKEMANLTSMLKVPKDSINYLKMGLKQGYHQWYWISVDPELELLRQTPSFKQFFKQTDQTWEKLEKSAGFLNHPAYDEYLKAKYFSKYHPLIINKTCAQNPKNPMQSCYNLLKKDYEKYIERVNSLNALSSLTYTRSVFRLDQKTNVPWKKLENSLNKLEINLLLLEAIHKKSKVQINNLIGNIFYYIKGRDDIGQRIETIIGKIDKNKKLFQILAGKKEEPSAKEFQRLLKRYSDLETRFNEFFDSLYTKMYKFVKRHVKDTWESIMSWHNEDNVKGYY